MGKAERDKGKRGELEVGHRFGEVGFHVRGLNGSGDKLVFTDPGPVLHVEVKRRETTAIPQWARQAEEEAPDGAMPIVVWRRSREPWRVDLSLDSFLRLLLLARGTD